MQKMKQIIFLLGIFMVVSIFGGSRLVQAETQEITSLEEPTWIFNSGMSRAKHHDRQDLGVVLNPGSTIRIKKKSTTDGYSNLNFRLLRNNRNEEKSISLTNEWQTISVEYASVPFVTTPYGQSNAEIEYEIDGSVTTLPIYDKDSDEEGFFDEWSTTNAAFGLVKGSNFQLLIPFGEKDDAKTLKDFANLNEYIAYQDSIIDYYDEIIGLTDDGEPWNQLPQNRFFLKADAGSPSGVGAYYGDKYTANGYATVVDMWMAKWDWATLHEIGHAYQPAYTNKGMYTGEVSNNLLAVYFTYQHRGKIDADKQSWLFDYGKKAATESELYDKLVNQQIGYPDLGHRQRLILLTVLTQAAGKENWIKFNRMYRELVNQGDKNIKNMSLPDLFTMYYSQQTKQDYSPIFAKWDLALKETKQPDINRGKGYPALASLVDVVPQAKLAQAVTDLSSQFSLVDSQFNLVTNQQLQQLQLPGGALTIHLNIDDFNQLKGKKLFLKDGTQTVKEVEISSQDLEIPDLPNGIYTVSYPATVKPYAVNTHYAYVRDAHNEMNVQFTLLKSSSLLDSTIYFKGISDATFALMETNFAKQELTFTTLLTTPHNYYANELYASVEVLDKVGNSIYKKEIEGTNVTKETDTIPLKEDYQIKIFHDETKSRLSASDADLIDKTTKTNILRVQNGTLVNQNSTSGIASSIAKIRAAVKQLLEDEELVKLEVSSSKTQILAAILSLPPEERNQLLNEYQTLLGIAPGTITVNYVDETGVAIDQPTIHQGRFGETLEVSAKAIAGFELISKETALSLEYQLDPQTVSFVYKRQETSSDTSNETTNEETTPTTTEETTTTTSDQDSESTSETSTSDEETTATTETSETGEETTPTTTTSDQDSESTSETSTSSKETITTVSSSHSKGSEAEQSKSKQPIKNDQLYSTAQTDTINEQNQRRDDRSMAIAGNDGKEVVHGTNNQDGTIQSGNVTGQEEGVRSAVTERKGTSPSSEVKTTEKQTTQQKTPNRTTATNQENNVRQKEKNTGKNNKKLAGVLGIAVAFLAFVGYKFTRFKA